jgi:hypothetical protein
MGLRCLPSYSLTGESQGERTRGGAIPLSRFLGMVFLVF